jgi:hypothetical protein
MEPVDEVLKDCGGALAISQMNFAFVRIATEEFFAGVEAVVAAL